MDPANLENLLLLKISKFTVLRVLYILCEYIVIVLSGADTQTSTYASMVCTALMERHTCKTLFVIILVYLSDHCDSREIARVASDT